jgi:hypothetical protein
MILDCVATQLDKGINDLLAIDVQAKVSVFHSAVATYHAPSDPSSTHGVTGLENARRL